MIGSSGIPWNSASRKTAVVQRQNFRQRCTECIELDTLGLHNPCPLDALTAAEHSIVHDTSAHSDAR
jgi:hypothetical protein